MALVKWVPSADSEQFMLIEHPVRELEKLTTETEWASNHLTQQQKLTLEFYEKE